MGGWGRVVNVLGFRPSRPRLLYFVAHASWYFGYVFSASLHTLHLTLDTSPLLRCTYVRVRWIRLLYFFAHTSSYVGHVFSTSLRILHVTLDTPS